MAVTWISQLGVTEPSTWWTPEFVIFLIIAGDSSNYLKHWKRASKKEYQTYCIYPDMWETTSRDKLRNTGKGNLKKDQDKKSKKNWDILKMMAIGKKWLIPEQKKLTMGDVLLDGLHISWFSDNKMLSWIVIGEDDGGIKSLKASLIRLSLKEEPYASLFWWFH